ncbi:MAG: hypothetical protein ACE366_01430 [Bradymonadia bacterium]
MKPTTPSRLGLVVVWMVLLTSVSPAFAQGNGFSPEIEAALEALKAEPTVQESQSAALQFFRIDPDTVSSMRTRAGWKALLPSVSANFNQVSNNIDLDTYRFDFDPTLQQVAVRDDAESVSTSVGVAASWDLPKLIFNAEVLDVSSLAVLQESVLKEITRIYYTRRRLQIDLILNPPTDPSTRLAKELRVEELTSTLDAMTGNLFSNQAKARSRRGKRRRRRPAAQQQAKGAR